MGAVAADAIRVAALTLAGIFLLAGFHKIEALAAGVGGDLPLMQLGRWRQRHAAVTLVVAVFAEAIAVGLLIAWPPAGLSLAFMLLVLYTVEVRKLRAGQSCGCLPAPLDAEPAVAVRRNVSLAVLSISALTLTVSGVAQAAPISQSNAGAAVVLLAAGAAPIVLSRLSTAQAGVVAQHADHPSLHEEEQIVV